MERSPKGFLIVIRGPLGVGKTTVSRRLARRLHGKAIAIDRILDHHRLERWYGGYVSQASFLRVNRFAVREATPLLRRGTPVIIEGNFYWEPVIHDLLRRLPFPHQVITLYAPMEVCRARDAHRKVPLGSEGVERVYRKVTAFDYGLAVDATGSIEAVLARLTRAVPRSRESLRRSGRIQSPGLSIPRPANAMPRVKVQFIYAGIRVRQLARSLRFYRKLGFRVYRRGTMGHGGRWVHLAFPGASQRLELNFYPRSNRFFEPFRRGTEFDHLGFRVSDVERWEAELRHRGFPIVARIREAHENIVYTRDPDGNWIEFFGPMPA